MKIRLKSGESYDILINRKLKLDKNKKYLVVTDSNLFKLAKQKFNIPIISFKAGEKSKNLKTISELTEKALSLGIDRRSTIISFGGGIVGDVAGFLAGTYMRGIDYIQIPTNLLAMVDSSIGGKVGVDVKNGKNISGLFYHPKLVYIDINYLQSLPGKELKNGLSEVIKYGVIYDKAFFVYLEKNLDKIFKLNKDALIKIITRSCQIKSKIVGKDEREADLRMVLNFGHTIGHAIESYSDYKIPHGEAIALGMVYEARIANKLGLLSDSDLKRIESLIQRLNFNTTIKLDSKLINLMKHDKKAFNNKIRFVLPTKIGKVIISDNVPDELIKEVLK